MKKLFFFTVIDFENWEKDGVCKKIISQVNVFREEGYDVETCYLLHGDTYINSKGVSKFIGHKKGLINKGTLCRYVYDYILAKNYDVVYIRYGFAEKEFYHLLKQFRKISKTVILEIATYPYDKEFSVGWDRKVALWLDKLYRNRMKKYIDRVVTFSNDSQIFGIPAIKIVNGVDFNKIKIRNIKSKDDTINLIAVASMSRWHGYDRFLNGLGEYYRSGGKRKVVIHLVGNGEEIPVYKDIVSEYHLSENVVFYGAKSGEELDQIYDKCSIAVASLALHRLNVFLASTLKTREYAAKGLPIITSSEIDIFPSDKCSFICKFSEDEQNINIEQVINFYDCIYNKSGERETAEQIRNYARKICDMDVSMKKVLTFIQEKEQGKNG